MVFVGVAQHVLAGKERLAKASAESILRGFLKGDPKWVPTRWDQHATFTPCNLERVSLQDNPQQAVRQLQERHPASRLYRPQAAPIILTDLGLARQKKLNQSYGDLDWVQQRFGDDEIETIFPLAEPTQAHRLKLKAYMGLARSHRVSLTTPSAALDYDFMNSAPGPRDAILRIALPDTDTGERVQTEPLDFAFQASLLGLPFHAHDTTLNEVVSGRKHWLFYPPSLSCNERLKDLRRGKDSDRYRSFCRDPDYVTVLMTANNLGLFKFGEWCDRYREDCLSWVSRCRENHNCSDTRNAELQLAVHWMAEVLPTLPNDLRPRYRCTVGPGELVVVPHQWWHMTVNVEDVMIVVHDINVTRHRDEM